MKKLYTTLAAGLLLIFTVSCTTSPTSELSVEPVDVAVAENVYQSNMIGTWRGIIPCADCPGITYNLTLNDDNSFEETLIYPERSAQPLTREGKWQLKNGIVELENSQEGRFRFSLADEELVLLDNATGKPIETELTTMYHLKRDAGLEDSTLPQWNDTRKRGVDFVGNGNDSGWLVEVDVENGMFFKTRPTETIAMTTAGPVTPEVSGNRSTYRAETTLGEQLVVVFIKEACADAMSGKESAYTVTVTAKGKKYKGCGIFLNATAKE